MTFDNITAIVFSVRRHIKLIEETYFSKISSVDPNIFSPVGTSIFANQMFNIFRVILYNRLIFDVLKVENIKRR